MLIQAVVLLKRTALIIYKSHYGNVYQSDRNYGNCDKCNCKTCFDLHVISSRSTPSQESEKYEKTRGIGIKCYHKKTSAVFSYLFIFLIISKPYFDSFVSKSIIKYSSYFLQNALFMVLLALSYRIIRKNPRLLRQQRTSPGILSIPDNGNLHAPRTVHRHQ